MVIETLEETLEDRFREVTEPFLQTDRDCGFLGVRTLDVFGQLDGRNKWTGLPMFDLDRVEIAGVDITLLLSNEARVELCEEIEYEG